MVQRIVSYAENLTSIALTGTGGIGKTSVILTALYDHRIRERFGDNRRFIRCDQFPVSHAHFLRKLSEAAGTGVENPENLSLLRRYLSSKEMIIVLDNAESILGLPETDAQNIHATVDELSQFSNICLIITSRISNTLPAHCEIIKIPTLSMEAGYHTFYRIYRFSERSYQINEILKELDFHPLSITLLATVAQQNQWDTKRLTAEWGKRRTGVLYTRHMGSLAATIDLSLASPMFQELGPDARELLEAVAFFPQGVDEDNADWLFPTISDGPNIFDVFCNLSLTHRSNTFIKMLAPLRDYLRPKDPTASPLLRKVKEQYFRRLSIDLSPGEPSFHASRWITSEDVNLEHLLDVFTSIDTDSKNVWGACNHFMNHLYWHKPRLVTLGSKVEALPDSHPFKPYCLVFLSRLFDRVGNSIEQKRILVQSLGLWRERGDEYWVAETLAYLSDANRKTGLYQEGIQQAREASEIFGRLGDAGKQAQCLVVLASSLRREQQLDAAGEAASRAINLSENRDQHLLCQCYQVLGAIHQSKGNTDQAVHHFEASLRIASLLDSHGLLSEGHLSMARLHIREGRLSDAQTHLEHAKSHTGNDTLRLARVIFMNACALYEQHRFREAKLEALRALDVFEKLGAVDLVEQTRQILENVEEMIHESHHNGKPSSGVPCRIYLPLSFNHRHRTQTRITPSSMNPFVTMGTRHLLLVH